MLTDPVKIKNYSLVAFLFIIATIFSSCAISQKTPVKQKYNILFIAVDDLKPLLHCYGDDQMHTPNFDRLASMGAIFTNAQVQQAVCGPSRASLMTACYPDRTKVWDLQTDFRESAPDLVSMPEYLISNGYETTATGKIYHKGSTAAGHDGKSWSVPYVSPDNDFDPKYGQPMFSFYQDPGTKSRMAELQQEAKNKGIKNNNKVREYVFEILKPSTECYDAPNDAYLDGLHTKVALDKFQALKNGNKPWMLAVGYQKPHLPFVAPKKYWDLYKRDEIKLANFRKISEGTPELAFHDSGELKAYSDIPEGLTLGVDLDPEKQRELIHGYMACVSYIDDELGKLLDELEKNNMLENTIITLYGDHGFHLGDHTLWCKHSNFEQATRAPLFIAGPGVAKGVKITDPVEVMSIFPTILDITGIPAHPQSDGISLLPLIDNNPKTKLAKDYAISQYPRAGGKMGYSLRTDRYRYTEWFGNKYKSTDPFNESNIVASELYDYLKDPDETRNLVNDPEYAKVLLQVKQKLHDHLQSQSK